jgi:hypothetical protein
MLGLGDMAAFENRQPVTATRFINKNSLFILFLGIIRLLELMVNSEKIPRLLIANVFLKSRMNREVHVRFREELGVKIHLLTRLYVRPSPRSSTMWVCVQPQSVARALAQCRLFCKVGFCVSALCALQMCLTWCVGQLKFCPVYCYGEIIGFVCLLNVLDLE